MKKSNLWRYKIALVPALLFPYIVAFSPNPDSSYTTLEFAAGTGSYAEVSRDCSGNVLSVKDIPFQDGGMSVDHYFSSFRVGAKAGLVHNGINEILDVHDRSFSYFNPNAGLNTRSVGLNVGALFYRSRSLDPQSYLYGSQDPQPSNWSIFPTGALRLGKSDGTFFSIGSANNLPLLTGGGFFDIGVGFNLGRSNSSLWLGVAGGPYDAVVFSTKGDIPLSNKVVLNLRSQVEDSESLEYGLSAGTRITF